MRNSIYQSLSDIDKEKIQNNMKLYPHITTRVYSDLNYNYYVGDITISTLIDLSSILEIYDISRLINHLFYVTQVDK